MRKRCNLNHAIAPMPGGFFVKKGKSWLGWRVHAQVCSCEKGKRGGAGLQLLCFLLMGGQRKISARSAQDRHRCRRSESPT